MAGSTLGVSRSLMNGRRNCRCPTKMLLKTITSVPGRFAEMAIQMPEGVVFGRLLLDPFSLGVFSSKGATVQRRKAYEAEGLTTVEAVARMVERSEVV